MTVIAEGNIAGIIIAGLLIGFFGLVWLLWLVAFAGRVNESRKKLRRH